MLLLCPDGKLPSPRWWPVAALTGVVLACVSLSRAVMPGDIDQLAGIENPLAIESLSGVADVGAAIGFFSLLPATLGSAASMVWRFRRSRGQERLQLKWFALAAILAGLTLFVSMTLLFAGIDVWTVSFPLAASLVGVAAGMAVLREGLYDVDRIINRTLVYALLTATLAAVYVVIVLALQAIFRPISGGSDLSIAITTLIVAALFMPARRRVQTLVDQRFNRRAYDAARTLDAFGLRLRQNLDLETLQSDLVTVVKQTMEPSRVSVWLRPGRDVVS